MKKRKLPILIFFFILSIFIAYLILLAIVKYHKNEFQVPVLMYHDVILDEYYNNKPDTISLTTFKKQLDYLKENNYKTLTLDEFYRWKEGKLTIPKKSVLLTFDDGFYSFHYLVEPLLNEYNMHAICFIIGEFTGKTTPQYEPLKYGTIGIDQIYNHTANVEYGSHSFGLHKMIDSKKKVEVSTKEELNEDLLKINKIYSFEYMSYPFNTDTDEEIKVLKKHGYKLAFRGESEKTTKNANNYQIPRIGIDNEIENFVKILETDYHNNRYGTGLLRKILITIERKIGKRIFK